MNDFEKNNFADFTASSAMKDIGFDEPCLTSHSPTNIFPWWDFRQDEVVSSKTAMLKNSELVKQDWAAAPLFQQATKYFRETHNMDIQVTWHASFFVYEIKEFIPGTQDWETLEPIDYSFDMGTEPDAYNAAIIKAAKIVKEKQNR